MGDTIVDAGGPDSDSVPVGGAGRQIVLIHEDECDDPDFYDMFADCPHEFIDISTGRLTEPVLPDGLGIATSTDIVASSADGRYLTVVNHLNDDHQTTFVGRGERAVDRQRVW